MNFKKVIYFLSAAFISIFCFNIVTVRAAEFKASAKVVYTFPTAKYSQYTTFPTVAFSNSGEQLVYQRLLLQQPITRSIVYNGKEINDNYRYVDYTPSISLDGQNYEYTVTYSDNRANALNYHIILNGQDYANYKMIDSSSFLFSANGLHNAFLATVDDKKFIVYDKREQAKYDFVSRPNLSPDGKILTYSAKNSSDTNKSLIVNEKVVGSYTDIKFPVVFSSDGAHMAYAAQDGGWFVFVDGKKVSTSYDDISNLSVGKSGFYAFIGKKGNSYVANLNGQESKSYTGMAGLVISPDEKQSIFIGSTGNMEKAVINGVEGPEYPIFNVTLGSIPAFSADSKHSVYKASRFTPDGLKRLFLYVVDGQEMTADGWYFSGFNQGNKLSSEFIFSPDSRYLIYMSMKGDNQIVKNMIDLTGQNSKIDLPVAPVVNNSSVKKIETPIKATSSSLNSKLLGQIIIQSESKGEVWYVNPKDGKKYYLATGNEILQLFKKLAVGMNNKDVNKMKTDAAFRKKFIGKILMQVESHGEIFYISSNGRYNYLKDSQSAYEILKKLGVKVSNSDINKIVTGTK